MASKKVKYIIGIDEVGRGALAGPVTVAALLLPYNFQFSITNLQKDFKIKLKDSKKLSVRQREIWFEFIKKHPKIFYAIACVSPKIIDKINISNAANLAVAQVFAKLVNRLAIAGVLTRNPVRVLLDGGLYLNKNIRANQFLWSKNPRISASTIIKGDEKIPAIALASIIAKISRDRMMKKLHKKYPQYDFINNVGYGTEKHIAAIKKYGRLPIHRESFKIKAI